MALTGTITAVEASGQLAYVYGKLTASGNYSTGGDTLNFSAFTADPSFQGLVPQIEALGAPIPGTVYVAGTTGDSYGFVQGTTQANGKVKINTTSATELGAGAYPGRITGDTNLTWQAAFNKL